MSDWERWIDAPERVCPRLAAPALVRGRCLQMRVNGQDHTVRASPRFLDRLYRWCTGEHSLAEISSFSERDKLGPKFMGFLDALQTAGLLIDAAQFLPGTARSARDAALSGRPAPEAIWLALRAELPSSLPPEVVSLPNAPLQSLSALHRCRRSAQSFAAEAVSLPQLSALLQAMYGSFGTRPGGRPGRSVPSAGGCYRLQLSVVLLKPVGPLVAGVYNILYAANGDVGLARIDELPRDLLRAFLQPYRLVHASGVVVVASDLRTSGLKYRNRSYPYALLEAGGVLQNAALAAAELDIGWRPLGGFDDKWLGQALHLPSTVMPLASGVFGRRPEGEDCSGANGLSFSWVDSIDQPQFHLASARWSANGGQAEQKVCWGRDRDPVVAYNKAVAEAVERAAYRARRGDIEASAAELPGAWIHPDKVVRYTSSQRRHKDFPFGRFTETQKRSWVRAIRIDDGEPVWVLSDFVFSASSFGEAVRPNLVFHATSSGCASQASLQLALEAAVLELVERDAFVRHWLAQRPGGRILNEALPVAVRKHVAVLADQDCEVIVQVLRPLGVPVWLVAVRSDIDRFTCVGAATGLDAVKALESAFNEPYTAAMVRLAGRRSAGLTAKSVRTPWDHADLHALPRHYRRSDPILWGGSVEDLERVVEAWPTQFDDVRARLARCGMDATYVVDLTMQETPALWSGGKVHTARAIVPGLIPLTFGYRTLPLGMVETIADGAEFPHPFP